MKIAQSQQYEGEDWWKWSVWIEGSKAQLDKISEVEWLLHPSFPKPKRVVKNRKTKFRLDTGGWGTFKLHAMVHLTSGDTEKLHHELELYYPDGEE